MQKLKDVVERFANWSPLGEYITRIEAYQESDFSLCVENAKALLESIGKEICKQRKQPLGVKDSVSKVLSLAFGSLGYPPSGPVRQIGTAIANVGQQMGNFRNDVGTTSHGRTLEEIARSRLSTEAFTGRFLVDSTELVACFLIEAIESKREPQEVEEGEELNYEDNEDFNTYLDEQFNSYEIGKYSYLPSEILFNTDPKAYKDELNIFKQEDNETDNGGQD